MWHCKGAGTLDATSDTIWIRLACDTTLPFVSSGTLHTEGNMTANVHCDTMMSEHAAASLRSKHVVSERGCLAGFWNVIQIYASTIEEANIELEELVGEYSVCMTGQILTIQERTEFDNFVVSSCIEWTKSSTVLVQFSDDNKTAESTSFVAVKAMRDVVKLEMLLTNFVYPVLSVNV